MPLTNAQFDSIMNAYSMRRLANNRLAEAHRREAFERIPELASIDSDISKASMAVARRKLAGTDGGDRELKYLHQFIEGKKQRRLTLLRENGYPEDYLDPIYTCPICRDTGFVDGKRCACFKQETTELLSRESNLMKILEKENFDHFSMDYYSKNFIDPLTKESSYDLMTKNVQLAREFIGSFGTDFSNMFLYGNTGLGKTFLSHCIAKELLDKGYFVAYFSASEFADMMSDRHFRRSARAMTLYERSIDADLVILDDMGTEMPNSFLVSSLFSFLNHRINAQLPTILSTNLTLDQFKQIYGDRIFSRLMSSSKFMAFVGEDIREQQRLISS